MYRKYGEGLIESERQRDATAEESSTHARTRARARTHARACVCLCASMCACMLQRAWACGGRSNGHTSDSSSCRADAALWRWESPSLVSTTKAMNSRMAVAVSAFDRSGPWSSTARHRLRPAWKICGPAQTRAVEGGGREGGTDEGREKGREGGRAGRREEGGGREGGRGGGR
jgi:hypothetical protein